MMEPLNERQRHNIALGKRLKKKKIGFPYICVGFTMVRVGNVQ